jgi:hypothetical protein
VLSQKQRLANSQNGKNGGPKTPAGKAKVSQNALKHGLTAQTILLPDEDPEEYDQFQNGFRQELNPVGPLEEFFFSQIVADAWRIDRARILEPICLQETVDGVREARAKDHNIPVNSSDPLPFVRMVNWTIHGAVAILNRYRTDAERHLHHNLKALKVAQQERIEREAAEVRRRYNAREASPAEYKMLPTGQTGREGNKPPRPR